MKFLHHFHHAAASVSRITRSNRLWPLKQRDCQPGRVAERMTTLHHQHNNSRFACSSVATTANDGNGMPFVVSTFLLASILAGKDEDGEMRSNLKESFCQSQSEDTSTNEPQRESDINSGTTDSSSIGKDLSSILHELEGWLKEQPDAIEEWLQKQSQQLEQQQQQQEQDEKETSSATSTIGSDLTSMLHEIEQWVNGHSQPLEGHDDQEVSNKPKSESKNTNTTGADLSSMLQEFEEWIKEQPGQEQRKKREQVEHDKMVDEYVESLMKDQDLVLLPMGMGTSSPIFMDMVGLNRSLVEKAIESFESTVDSWNSPMDQGMIVGHPIVYKCTYDREEEEEERGKNTDSLGVQKQESSSSSSSTKKKKKKMKPYLVHHPELKLPWEVLEVVADTLLENPRLAPNIFPKSIERNILINVLHLLTRVQMDIVLSSSVSIHNGAFQMSWTYHQDENLAYLEVLRQRNLLQGIVQMALQQIDFDVIEQQAAEALKDHTVTFYGEEELYSMAYKIMLVLFYLFYVDSEFRLMGRSVRMNFVKPTKSNNNNLDTKKSA